MFSTPKITEWQSLIHASTCITVQACVSAQAAVYDYAAKAIEQDTAFDSGFMLKHTYDDAMHCTLASILPDSIMQNAK